ncbi:MAG: TolC family protein, partial [Gemmatimonadota bacterium]
MKCRTLSLTLASFLAAGTLSAQDRAPLTLEEAIRLAERNSPTYLQQLNDLGPANWGVRAARAGLFLPTADASFFTAWQDGGEQRFGAFTSTQPAVLLSSWNFNLRYTLNGTTLFRPGQRAAERKAVEARIDDAGLTLRTQVTSAYVEVLRLQDRAEQASRELRRS